MNFRSSLMRQTDGVLKGVYIRANEVVQDGEKAFRIGDITADLALQTSEQKEILDVVRAVGRTLRLEGGPNSHKELEDSIAPSPKKINARFGEGLRRRRGAE